MAFARGLLSVFLIFNFKFINAVPVYYNTSISSVSTNLNLQTEVNSPGFCPAEGCLCGWDIGLAVREDTLNEIIKESIDKYFGEIPFPELNYHDPPPKQCEDPVYLSTGLRIAGLKMDNLRLTAVQGQEQTGHLVAHFTAGTVYMSSDYINVKTKTVVFKGPVRKFSMANGRIKFNTRVTSHRFIFEKTRDGRSVKYEVVGDDAIVGIIEFMSDISIQQVRPVNLAFTAFMKRILKKGNIQELGTFVLPKEDPTSTSLIQDLFPHSIRFSLSYQSGGKSVIVAVGTKSKKEPDFLNFAADFLMEQTTGFAFIISGTKFMKVFQEALASMTDGNLPLAGHIKTTSDCPPKIVNTEKIWLKTQKIASIFHITPYIKEFSMEIIGDMLKIKINMWMDFSVWPMKEEIDMELNFKITYDSSSKKYKITSDSKSHTKTHHCDEIFKVLRWFNLILRLADYLIEKLVDKLVDDLFWDKIDDILNLGDPIYLPTNVGGPVGEFVKKMSVSQIGVYKGNWLTNFQLNLNH